MGTLQTNALFPIEKCPSLFTDLSRQAHQGQFYVRRWNVFRTCLPGFVGPRFKHVLRFTRCENVM